MQKYTSYIIYKPYGMLSQFTRPQPQHITLADLDFTFPNDVYPVGRLDADSEGLLILTNNKRLNAQLLRPKNKQIKTYWAQVEGAPSPADLAPLQQGITINLKGKKHHCAAAQTNILSVADTAHLPERHPPIRYRKNIPDTWISIGITEGKNRQVRRMCSKVGFPVLRLVRVGIAGFTYGKGQLTNMKAGDVLPIVINLALV